MVKLTPLRILFAGWIVFLLYAYPGYLDVSGADILFDARAEVFGDWHSPVMAKLWYVLGHVISGPPGMLVLQSGLLLFGAYHLLRRACTDRTAAWVACGVLLFPPVMAIEAVVCPQSLFAGWTLAGAALLASERPRRKIGGLVMLLVAAGLHAGSTIAVLPLVLFGFRWRAEMPHARRFAIAATAWIVIALGAYGLEYAIVDVVSNRRELLLAKHDLKGIVEQTGEPKPFVLALSGDHPEERTAIFAAREQMISAHRGAYVKHRLHHLWGMLLSSSKLRTQFTATAIHAQTTSHRARHSLVQRALIAPLRVLSKTPLFWPLVYMIAAVACCVVAAVRRQYAVIAWFASGILYEVIAAFFVVATDRRLSHWLVVSTVFGVALLAVSLRKDRGDRPEVEAAAPVE